MIDKSESLKSNQTMDEFRRALYLIAEAIAKHNKILITNHKDIIEHILPVLI
jgi:single-stranded DNA-specific DHH superfamily exonuclease